MRFNILFITFLLGPCLSGVAQLNISLDTAEYRSLFKFDLGAAIDRDLFALAYEHVLNDYWSVQMTGGLYEFEERRVNAGIEQYHTLTGWMVRPELRRYLNEFTNNKSPHSAFVGAFAIVQEENRSVLGDQGIAEGYGFYPPYFEWQDIEIEEVFRGAGISFGAQLLFAKGLGFELVIDLMLGYDSFSENGEQLLDGEFVPYNRKNVSILARSGGRASVVYAFGRR